MKNVWKLVLLLLLCHDIPAQTGVLINDFPVSENRGQGVYRPSISVSNDGQFFISWGDERNGENYGGGIGHIYACIYSNTGTPLIQNFVADNTTYSNSYFSFSIYSSSTLYLPNGSFAVSWHVDARAGVEWGGIKSDDVYLTLWSANGQLITQELQLNRLNNLGSGYAYQPSLIYLPPSSILAVFRYSLNSQGHIGAILVDATTGNRIGETAVISDNATNGRIYPFGASNGSHTVVVWTDGRLEQNLGDIYLQRFLATSPSGVNIKVNDNSTGYNQYARVAMNNKGEFVVAWIDTRASAAGDIFAQCFNQNGEKVGTNIKLTNSNSFMYEYPVGLAMMEDGSFTAAWTDSVANERTTAKMRTFSFNGTPLNEITPVSNAANNSQSGQVDVKSSLDGKLYFTWLDGRDGGKGRIYAKVIGSPVSDIAKNSDIALDYCLDQNYPNPFNPSTNITYRIAEAGQVRLSVFNLLGEEIAILVNDFKKPGIYKTEFSTQNYQLPTGVYFYKLQTKKFVSIKKMIFVK